MIELPAKPRLPPRLGLEPRSSTHGSKGFDRMFLPDGDVEVLARDMLKQFPADAADRAMLRSNAFFVLGRTETSKKWLQITQEIKKIQVDQT